jgi:hypothetical protein
LKQAVGLKRKFGEWCMMYVTQCAKLAGCKLLADSGMQTLVSDNGRTGRGVNRTFMDYWQYMTLETELEVHK